jgi:AcrR family transcriptional regulator
MSQVGRRQRRQSATQEKIFRAALRLFAERGFHETRVEDITEAADVGKGTFFNYFPGKEHVLAAFADLQLAKIASVRDGYLKGHGSLHAALRRLFHSLAEEPGRSPGLVRSLIVTMASSPAVRQRMRRNLWRARRMLAAMIAAGQVRGQVRGDAPAARLARVLQQSAFGGMLFWSLHPPTHLVSWLDASLQVFWDGIGKE